MNSFRYRVVIAAMHWAVNFESDALVQRLGAQKVQITPCGDGRYVVTAEMQRDSHPQAIEEIESALLQLGWSVAEAAVEEWLDKLGQSLVLAALGGAGGSRFSGGGAVLGGAGGFALGLLVRPVVKIAEHALVRTAYGWHFQPAEQRTPRVDLPWATG